MTTWLLQANPARWRIFDFVADGQVLRSWTVKRYLNEPAVGDRAVLWLSGTGGGVVGLGRVTGTVEDSGPENGDPYWTDFAPTRGAHRLPIAIDEYFLDNPVPRSLLEQDQDFANASILRAPASTNPFRLTDEQWGVIERLLSSDDESNARWELSPGDTIRRVELHERFGGSGRNGISPSARTANVFIFTDPRSGLQLGYRDEWLGDDVFLYSGEGQIGDQTMTSGNAAILNHLPEGRTLRVFDGVGGVVRYVGEFAIDIDQPYRIIQGRQRNNSSLRDVIQFRLLRLAEPTPEAKQEELVTGRPYRPQDEEGQVAPPSAPRNPNPDAVGRGLRQHRRLQNELAAVVEASGYVPWSPAPNDPDFDLAWSPNSDHVVVVEIKSLTRTNEIRQLRMGLGQVLDYHDTLSQRYTVVTPVLYLPRQPSDPRWVSIARRVGVEIAWPDNHVALPGM